MNAVKTALRQEYKKKRLALTDQERMMMDDLMLIQLQSLYLGNVQRVLTYWPISSMGEPNMHLYNGWLRHSIPQLSMVYSKIVSGNPVLSLVEINENTIYRTNNWGVMEPEEGPLVSPVSLDLILVPLLICNSQGYRVGYGKGYYDRLLNECREDAILLGFSYFDPIDIVFEESWDLPLHYLITPRNLHQF